MLGSGAEPGRGDAAGDNGVCTGWWPCWPSWVPGGGLLGPAGTLPQLPAAPARRRSPPGAAAMLRWCTTGFCWPCLPHGHPGEDEESPVGTPVRVGEEPREHPGEDEESPVCPGRADGMQSTCQPSAATEGDEQGNRLLLAESQLSKIPN